MAGEYRLKRGDVFLISPETEAWYEADQKDPWFYSWVGFCGVKAKECMDNAGLSSKRPVCRIENIDYIKQLIEKILEEFQLSYKCELRRNAYLMLIFSELVEAYMEKPPAACIFTREVSMPGTLSIISISITMKRSGLRIWLLISG